MPTSNNREDASKTPTATIKIAAKDSSQRAGAGQADPGPGDPNAEPSQAPELVSIPAPPTASELVVKSTSGNSRVIKTINDPVSLRKNSRLSASVNKQIVNDSMGLKANPDIPGGAPRESTSSKALSSNPPVNNSSAHHSGSKSGSGAQAGGPEPSGGGPMSAGAASGPSPTSPGGSTGRFNVKSTGSAGSTGGGAHMRTASQAMTVSPGGNVQDEVEDGEGEIEHPPDSPSPGASGAEGSSAGGGIDTAPASSGGGASKMSPKTSGSRQTTAAREPSGSGKPRSAGGASDASEPSDTGSVTDGAKKKVTKFRYHKRITVRTHGKTSPSQIMDKVNKKDHKQGITPSTIEDMDPQELMKRAGIKGNKNGHWRVRLRQTKRMTKNGKTVTQTKVAYRDSEGNKRVKTVLGPNCKKCGKKLEECKCDD